MATRYRRQALYVLLLVGLAVAIGRWSAPDDLVWPGPATWLFAIAAFLFVWQFGVTAPAMGLVSLERIPQFGFLLVFEPTIAAGLNAAAALIFPFINRRYRQGSFKVAALRAVHNAAMTAFILLAAGAAYRALHGSHPLQHLTGAELLPLAVAALVAQAVNLLMLALFYWLDGRDPRRIFTPLYAFGDLLFVPGGVLVAVIYTNMPAPAFWLLIGLLVFFVLSFHESARSQTSLEAELGAIKSAAQTGAALTGARRVDEVADAILDKTRALIRFDEFELMMLDSERQELDFRLHERAGARMPRRRKRAAAGLFGWVLGNDRPLLLPDCARLPPEIIAVVDATDKRKGSLIAVPLVADGQSVGLISVQHGEPGVYSDADLNLMRWLADQAAGALANARAFEELDEYKQDLERRVADRTAQLETANREKEQLVNDLLEQGRALEQLSREDPLTGLGNRRYFDERLDQEMRRATRLSATLSVALLDLDHFKQVNDSMGHAIGDTVLREVAELMRQECRAVDVLARYGGEEFALVLPGAAADVLALGERIRCAVLEHDWESVYPGLQVTISIGIAGWVRGDDAATLVARADDHLYEAKRCGRNRVVA